MENKNEDVHSKPMDSLQRAPHIKCAKVVHACWLDIEYDPMWKCMKATCSNCRVRGEVRTRDSIVPASPYCPECGAKMDLL